MDRLSDIRMRETTNYEQFIKLLGNRDVTPQRVTAIKESILRIGYQPSPIIVNEKKEVIDGQGRLAATKALGIPVLYIEKEGLTIDDCISMNIKMKNWTDIDYLHSYAKRGFAPYVEMAKLLNEFPALSWVHLMVCEGHSSGPREVKEMRNGRLKFEQFTYEEYERARWISAMVPIIKKSSLNTQKAIETLIRLDRYKLIDKQRMLESIENYSETLQRGTIRAADTLIALNELYNYNRRSKKFFADDYKRMALAAISGQLDRAGKVLHGEDDER